ncbi:MAG: hypothetical protein HC814_08275 [Rhodobacteraceae bacterium]|nr:hypothetical protein [Paracoccaceae bacterium]
MTNVGIIGFDKDSAITYVVGTSTQINSINQDLNGVDGGISSSTTWAGLGAITDPYSVTGVAVPEPQTWATGILAAIGLVLHHRRSRHGRQAGRR